MSYNLRKKEQLYAMEGFIINKSNKLALWAALNRRIIHVIEAQTNETLSFAIVLPDGKPSDLKFLMTDYVDHFEHHLMQIQR